MELSQGKSRSLIRILLKNIFWPILIPILLVEKRANYSENPWYLTLHYMCLPFVNWHRKELLHRKYIVIYYATSLLNARSVFASDYVSMSVRIWSQSASLPWIKVNWITVFLFDCKIPLFLRLPFACFCFFFPPAVFFEAVMQSWILSAHEVKLPVSKSFFLYLQPSYSVVYLKIWDWKVSFNFGAALPAINN